MLMFFIPVEGHQLIEAEINLCGIAYVRSSETVNLNISNNFEELICDFCFKMCWECLKRYSFRYLYSDYGLMLKQTK